MFRQARIPLPLEGFGVELLEEQAERCGLSLASFMERAAQRYVAEPDRAAPSRRVPAFLKDGGRAVLGLNELEMVGEDLLANVWHTNQILLIDPMNGRVKARWDLTGLLRISDRTDSTDVLNGVAYDAERDRLFVTGKLWPKLFEIRLEQVR